MKNVESRIKYCVFFFLFSSASFSQDTVPDKKENNIQIHGYVKNLQSFYFTDQPGSLLTGNLIHNRINFKWDIRGNFYTRIEARNRLFLGEQVKQTYLFGKLIDNDKGIVDLSYNVIDDTSLVFNTLLDRALLNWSDNKWEITFGRQRINWGINLVWNPNDIFNTFNYFDFDYEERPGTDAFRVQYYSRKASSFELAYKLSDKADEQVGAFMYKTNFKGYDMQYFFGIYFQDVVAGAGWAGNIRQCGFKGEASYFHPYKNSIDTSGSLSLTLSIDRTFKKDYFAMMSYLYSSNGKNQSGNIGALSTTALSAKNLMPFEHAVFAQISKAINTLIKGSIGIIYSRRNHTLIMLPSLSGSISNNWELALISQSFFSEVTGTYKTSGNGVYLRLRYSY